MKMEQNVNVILSHTVTCGVITLACVRACVCVCVRVRVQTLHVFVSCRRPLSCGP